MGRRRDRTGGAPTRGQACGEWSGWPEEEGLGGETAGPAPIPPHSPGRWDGGGRARSLGGADWRGIPPRDLKCALKVGHALTFSAQES